MPTLFAAYLSLTSLVAVPPPVDTRLVWKPVRPAEIDILGDVVEQLEGVPIPIVDPFRPQVMVELHGTF
ncbi:MAG: hypothetical protein H6719_07785 [Sandaracinaceae bacterium]|nr:hypothetical protein [Sandaracinaceae bacterium]